jgi:hypothetical protein
MVRSIVARATRAKLQRARFQARLGSTASREEKSAELDVITVPQFTALCGRYGLDRKGGKADLVSRLCIALCKDEPVTAAKLASEDAREAKRVELCGLKVPTLKGLCEQHNLSKAGVKADLVSRLCDALAPVVIAKRTAEEACTGEAARETKLAKLRAESTGAQAAVRPARRAQDGQKGKAASAAVRRAEQRRTTCGEKEFLEARGAKDAGPAGDAESAVPEEAWLAWSCSVAERWRSVRGHGEAGACTQVEYVNCVRAERYGGAQNWRCGGIGA